MLWTSTSYLTTAVLVEPQPMRELKVKRRKTKRHVESATSGSDCRACSQRPPRPAPLALGGTGDT